MLEKSLLGDERRVVRLEQKKYEVNNCFGQFYNMKGKVKKLLYFIIYFLNKTFSIRKNKLTC